MTLREPPKTTSATGVLGRMVGLLFLLAVFALVVWTATTHQQASAIERSDPLVHAPGEYVAAADAALHVRTVGRGGASTVVVHPDWVIGGAPLMPVAEELAERDRRVIVPDLVGFGFSPRAAEPGRRLSTTGQAEELSALLDEMGLAGVELIGFGWGGAVAAEVAVTRPDLVSRLVMVDTEALPVPGEDIHNWSALPLGVGEAVAFTWEGASGRARDRFLRLCPSWADCASGEILEQYRRTAEVPGTARAIWARRATEPASVAPGRLGEVSVPVLLVEVDGEIDSGLSSAFADAEEVEATADGLVEAIAG